MKKITRERFEGLHAARVELARGWGYTRSEAMDYADLLYKTYEVAP